MEALIWIGAGLTCLGLLGICWSIIAVIRARKSLEDDALKARMARILPVNIGAFFLSMIGLMGVLVGVLLS